MSIYIEKNMPNIRDMSFETLALDQRDLDATFWSFLKNVLTYSKRM